MIKLILISLLFTYHLVAQDIPQTWLEGDELINNQKTKHNSQRETPSLSLTQEENLDNKFENIISTHNNIIRKLSHKYPNLDRLDLGLGLNASGSLGIFSIGKSSSIELIWRRNNQQEQNSKDKEITVNIDPTLDEDDLFKTLESNLRQVINFQSIKNSIKRKIIKTLYKDAKKVRYFARTVLKTPQVGNWYISSFWRNYYFSSSIGFLDNLSLGYEKRIRFRFKVINAPLRPLEKVYNPFIMSVLNTLNVLETRDNLDDGLDLYRCRAQLDFEVGLNLFFFSKSVGKGFLVEFKKNKKFSTPIETNHYFHHRVMSKVTNSINRIISRKVLDGGELELNQVRYSFSLSGEIDFVLASIEKSSSLDLHFKRVISDIFNDDEDIKRRTNHGQIKTSPIGVKQIDYRNRLNFSFGIPYINRIRMRPSIEYRYRPE